MTVNVWPAIVIVPLRLLDDGFDATEYLTEPLPEPVVPLLIVIQDTLLVADHGPVPPATSMLPVPPDDPKLAVVALRLYPPVTVPTTYVHLCVLADALVRRPVLVSTSVSVPLILRYTRSVTSAYVAAEP